MDFSIILWEVLKKGLLGRYIQLCFMHVCIVSKPKSEKNRKIEEKSFQGVSKTEKKKKNA